MEMTRFLALIVISVVSHVFTQVPGGESTMDNSHVRGTFKCTGPRNSPPKTADADMTPITTLAQHDTTKSTERPESTTEESVKYQSMYWHSDDKVTWSEAVEECNLYNNGHLVHIDNKEENDEVKAFLEQTNIGHEWIWIGIHDSKNKGVWTYEDGSNLTYVNWRDGEPTGEYQNEDEDCSVIKDGYYNDINCEKEFHFCCEYYVVIE